MPNHHLLNGLFSHGGREKYPLAALNWVLVVPNLIHTYIHVDRLYVQRSKGGRGLRSIEDLYEIRTVSMMKHFEEAEEKHSLLKLKQHEEESISRLRKEFLIRRKEFQSNSNAKEGTRKEHEGRWKGKETHGYLQKTLEQDETIGKTTNG